MGVICPVLVAAWLPSTIRQIVHKKYKGKNAFFMQMMIPSYPAKLEGLMRYRLQHRIHTLAELCDETTHATDFVFTVEGITFSQPQRSIEMPSDQFWLAVGHIEADGYDSAWTEFRKRLVRIVPRVAVACQCYIEFLGQPVLITRDDLDIGFIHWIKRYDSGGLRFMEPEQKAVELLLEDKTVPDEFFYYWNDALNSSGYAAKLLLMLAGVEMLSKVPNKRGHRNRDPKKLEMVLGPKLKKELWGVGNANNALRSRLVHGEYFNQKDGNTNHVESLQHRLTAYLNEDIFKEDLLDARIVDAPRGLDGVRTLARAFLRARRDALLHLPNIMAEAVDGVEHLPSYETLRFDDYQDSF